jgi:hypothetical protein
VTVPVVSALVQRGVALKDEPLGDLLGRGIRVYAASVFFLPGLARIPDGDSTVARFERATRS